jgi:5'-methylthioadenosine/S-adenosylhomocysteine nucleosidase
MPLPPAADADTTRYVIIGAMEEEVAEFLAHARVARVSERPHFKVHEGELFGVQVAIVKCGVGKVFAALITQHLIDRYAPAAVISTGVAGGLSPALSIGDVVASRDCIQHDMDVRALGFVRGHIPYSELRIFWGDESLLKRALGVRLESRHSVVAGRILTGDQFISGERHETHGHLTGELEGDAVDMESAAIAQVCFVNAVPFLSVRTISDKADGTAHVDFNAFLPEVARNSFDVVRGILSGV